MPSFNLPSYPTIHLPAPHNSFQPNQHKSSQSPPAQKKRRSAPPPLSLAPESNGLGRALGRRGKSMERHDREKEKDREKEEEVLHIRLRRGDAGAQVRVVEETEVEEVNARRLPASIKSPHTKQWVDSSPRYRRSPLSPTTPSSSNTPTFFSPHNSRHLSRRYLPPPYGAFPLSPQSTRSPIQQHISLPRQFTAYKDPRMFEEIVARVLEKRLRDKCLRGRGGGEKAGLGVGGGREIWLLAILGVVREKRKRAPHSERLPISSAPPTQITFGFNNEFDSKMGSYPSDAGQPPTRPKLTRPTHRKSSSFSTFPSPVPNPSYSSSPSHSYHREDSPTTTAPPNTFKAGLLQKRPLSLSLNLCGMSVNATSLSTLDTIREFVNRRSLVSGGSHGNGEVFIGEKEYLANKLAPELVLLDVARESVVRKEVMREQVAAESRTEMTVVDGEEDRRGRTRERSPEPEQKRKKSVAIRQTSTRQEIEVTPPTPVSPTTAPTRTPSPKYLAPPPSPHQLDLRAKRLSCPPIITTTPPTPTVSLSPSPERPLLSHAPLSKAQTPSKNDHYLALPSSPARAFLRSRSDDSFERRRVTGSVPLFGGRPIAMVRGQSDRGSVRGLPSPLFPIAAVEY